MIYYFAYGANMDLKRIEEMGFHFSSIKAAKLDNCSLKRLDFLEGYPRYYIKKKVVAINKDDGAKIYCITYVGNQTMIKLGLKPLRIYIKHLLSGRIFMSKKYFEKLKHVKTIKPGGHK